MLKDCKEAGVKLSPSDYNQVYQHLLYTGQDPALLAELRKVWERST